MAKKAFNAGQLIPTSSTPPSNAGFYRIDKNTIGVVGNLVQKNAQTNAESNVASGANFAAELAVSGKIEPPSGFLFDFSKLVADFAVYRNNLTGVIRADYDHTALIPSACRTAPLSRIIHVSPAGSDSNSGVGTYLGDFSNAKASVWSAVSYGNGLGAGYQVVVKQGTYIRNNTWKDTLATQPIWLRGWYDGGLENRPILSMHDNLTWSLDGTYTNCYKAARTSVLRVLDVTRTDSLGNFAELTNVASATLCNTTPDSWVQVGSEVFVRRLDGLAPTNSTTWAHVSIGGVVSGSGGSDIYVEGLRFVGGKNILQQCPTKYACFVDCDFLFQGGASNVRDAIQILDYNQVVFVRCKAAKSAKDGFNAHQQSGKIPQVLTIDCLGFDNGCSVQVSNNGFTTHDGVLAIDINGQYYNNQGGNFVCVDSDTQTWAVGSQARKSVGDGNTAPNDFHFSGAGKAWLESCRSAGSHSGLSGITNAQIFIRDYSNAGAFVDQAVSAGATISAY